MQMAHGLLFRDLVARYDIDELPFFAFIYIWIYAYDNGLLRI